MSLRTEADDEFSNRVTVTSVTLATDLADPLARLKAIGTDTVRAKEEAHHGAKGFMEFMQLFPPLVVNVLMHVTPAEQVPRMAGVNLVVSNVRGSDRPMYVAGAKAEAVYPMSIISPGGGLNVTCLSYAGQIHFGLTIEPSLVPDPWRLIDGLHEALATYSALAGKPSRRGKRTAGKTAAAPRKKPTTGRKKPATRRKKPAPGRPSTRKT